jgi:membrane associated rhomboid family serine protease
MVGPSMTDEDRETGMRRIQYTFVVMVAASGALIALQAEASLAVIVAAAVGGAVAGALLWWYLVSAFQSAQRETESRSRR